MKFKVNYASCNRTNTREVHIYNLEELAELSRIEGKRYKNKHKGVSKSGGMNLLISFPQKLMDKGTITVVDGYLD